MREKILILLFFVILFCDLFTQRKLLDRRFYDYKEVYPFLENLKLNRNEIRNEVLSITKEHWKDWPETQLYKNKSGWKVLPFYGFGFWIKKNCIRYPKLYSLLKKIPGLRTATLSRLTPGTKIEPHQGWAKLSNYVLKCQYGIIVDDDCILGCEYEVVEMKENKIIVFDDSKIHYAQNNGKEDRIILILDIDRPSFVKKGMSKVGDTTELNHFIEYMKTY
jgi:ornithine lipid ester-linked acyl 2-hydroxylase